MKFEYCGKKRTYTTFGELTMGDIFRPAGDTSLYIKTNNAELALMLDNGALTDFSDNEEIIPVEATVRWEDK